MARYGVFDVTGPIMIGPSSSHTAGAARLSKVAKNIIGHTNIKKVDFYLHGSFAETYKGHGTDKALLGGILGFETYDERIKIAFELADKEGLEYNFIPCDLGNEYHPNTVKFILYTQKGLEYIVIGSSLGGGKVSIIEIDGIKVNFNGDNPIIITKHRDEPGVISKISSMLYDRHINIGNMSVMRDKFENMVMMYITIDEMVEDGFIKKLEDMEEIKKVILLSKF
ncbi:MAG: L-serine ammonia-lyase, iron-sulfur-dependent subunit beta [Oscillospiraceae bacterium]